MQNNTTTRRDQIFETDHTQTKHEAGRWSSVWLHDWMHVNIVNMLNKVADILDISSTWHVQAYGVGPANRPPGRPGRLFVLVWRVEDV